MIEERVFGEVLRALGVLRIPYMVTGSVAVELFGVPRFTHDLDLIVDATPEQAENLSKALGPKGFYVPPSEVILD
jgi:hypothetical protein